MTIKADKAISGGLIVTGGKVTPATVLITGEKISAVIDSSSPFEAKETIAVDGKYVLPGIIDGHLHSVYIDRIDSLSRAAATEGITTLIPYVGSVKAWGVLTSCFFGVKLWLKKVFHMEVLETAGLLRENPVQTKKIITLTATISFPQGTDTG